MYITDPGCLQCINARCFRGFSASESSWAGSGALLVPLNVFGLFSLIFFFWLHADGIRKFSRDLSSVAVEIGQRLIFACYQVTLQQRGLKPRFYFYAEIQSYFYHPSAAACSVSFFLSPDVLCTP